MTDAVPPSHILVAEDDISLAEIVVEALQDEGFVVTLAGDGQLAVAAAAQTEFDALLTDLRMPNMDGIALIERLRADNPTLPVVVMSGHAPVNLTAILRRNGDGPFVTLSKPMSMRTLVEALSNVLARRNQAG